MTAHPPEEAATAGLPTAGLPTAGAATAGAAAAGVAAAGAEWALFTDWCAVTGHTPLPATPETVLTFFGECPAAPATQARRLTAIDAAHRAAGVAPPERSPTLSGPAGP